MRRFVILVAILLSLGGGCTPKPTTAPSTSPTTVFDIFRYDPYLVMSVPEGTCAEVSQELGWACRPVGLKSLVFVSEMKGLIYIPSMLPDQRGLYSCFVAKEVYWYEEQGETWVDVTREEQNQGGVLVPWVVSATSPWVFGTPETGAEFCIFSNEDPGYGRGPNEVTEIIFLGIP